MFVKNSSPVRTEYQNDLTLMIKTRSPSLYDVLKHEQLLTTLRNEAPSFLDFFFPPEEMKKEELNLPNFDLLIELALSSHKNPTHHVLFQLNRNASNVLCYPSRKFQELVVSDKKRRLFLKLRNFMNDSKNNQNSMFIGHFCRIFEAYLRSHPHILLANGILLNKTSVICPSDGEEDLQDSNDSDIFNKPILIRKFSNFEQGNQFSQSLRSNKSMPIIKNELVQEYLFEDSFSKEKFLDFVIHNCKFLPFREFLSNLLSEFISLFPNAIKKILHFAAIVALNLYDLRQLATKSKNDRRSDEEFFSFKKGLKKLENHSLNYKKEKIPFYQNLKINLNLKYPNQTKKDKFIHNVKRNLSYYSLHENKKENRSEDPSKKIFKNINNELDLKKEKMSFEEMKNLIYFLLSSIRLAFSFDSTILQKLNEDEDILLYLLTCGVFSDKYSIISKESFDLLNFILNDTNEDGTIKSLNLNPPSLVDDFAKFFEFDVNEITPQMIAALKIFWNHRFKYDMNKITTEKQQILCNLEIIDIDDKILAKHGISQYETKSGITVLEMLFPIALIEPPVSIQLSNEFLSIIKHLNNEMKLIYQEFNKLKNFSLNVTPNTSLNRSFNSSFHELLNNSFNKSLNNSLNKSTRNYLNLSQKMNEKSQRKKQKEMFMRAFEIDCVFYELRHRKIEINDHYFTILSWIKEMLPICPIQGNVLSNEEFKKIRAPTNGVIFELSDIFLGNESAFFLFKPGKLLSQNLNEQIDRQWAEKVRKYKNMYNYTRKCKVTLDENVTKENEKSIADDLDQKK
ncbi:hypothetical protein TRFO_24264 [Tritrichomonas foetus]|uniref:Uncharacterized protein n=1 Tax=Tritrichomonas foetus TaxID=1144522 RepID=A0A1J4K7U1_9EUKA|nr:hypothetical protein TRFO_24264 [Tritrichomonas foetus]|eukprot:OHT07455.1 hypothetical protein TRFO_24264 [Tritrichomonas foetus]